MVTPGCETECAHQGPLQFANGICINLENAVLYLVQSSAPNVLAFKLASPRLGSLQRAKVFEVKPDELLSMSSAISTFPTIRPKIGVIRPNGRFEVLYRDFMTELPNRPTNFSNLGGCHLGKIDHRLEPLDVIRP